MNREMKLVRRAIGASLAIVGTLLVTNGGLYLFSRAWFITNLHATLTIFGAAAAGVLLILVGLRLWRVPPTEAPDSPPDSN